MNPWTVESLRPTRSLRIFSRDPTPILVCLPCFRSPCSLAPSFESIASRRSYPIDSASLIAEAAPSTPVLGDPRGALDIKCPVTLQRLLEYVTLLHTERKRMQI